MKLRTKFAVVLLLVATVLSGGVYGGLELYKDRVVDQSRTDVQETADLSADQLDAAVDRQRDFVGFVASRPEAAQFNRSDRFLEEFVDNTRYFAAQVVDEEGTIVDFHGDITQEIQQESIGDDVSDRPYVATPLAGETYVSDPEYTNSTGEYLIIVSAPIFDDRELEGVFAAAIYLDRPFFSVVSPIATDDHRIVVRDGGATLFEQGEPFDSSIRQSAEVPSTGWHVTVDRNQAPLLAQLRDLAIAQGVGLLLVMLSVVSFGVWEYRTTLDQTEQLLEGFEALQEGDFDHELSLTTAEEWEQISTGFNAMSASLATREEQLHRREQRLRVLNRVLRHNLRNVAGIVLGYVDVIRNFAESEQVIESVESIDRAGTHLESLSEKAGQLGSLLDQDRELIDLDAAQLVADVLEGMDDQYPRVDVTSSLPDHAWVRADPSIRMAVSNVCDNACRHNDAGDPRLEVSIEEDASRTTIRVRDNGPGVPEHERSVLAAGEETPLHHGSGLGLWIAQWTVERSGGDLRFEENPAGGSTVVIDLPRTGTGTADATGAEPGASATRVEPDATDGGEDRQ